MGIMDFLFSSKNKSDQQFIETVRAHDNGEEWASREIQRMWNEEGSSFFARFHRARVSIYENAAQNGDRDAIIKYARGLAYSGRGSEAVGWYMSLINRNDSDAMLELALDYNKNGPLGYNPQEELKWISAAAHAGNAEGQYKYAQALFISGDRQNSAEWYKKASEQGHTKGMLEHEKNLSLDAALIARFISAPEKAGNEERDKIRKYNIPNYEAGIETIINIYQERENLLIDVLNNTNDEDDVRQAHTALAMLYLYPTMKICKPMPYRAAYFYYQNYYLFEDDFAFENVKKAIGEYNLNITNRTLDEWQNMSFDEWAQMYGISE